MNEPEDVKPITLVQHQMRSPSPLSSIASTPDRHYDADGKRDNPKCSHFLRNEPVERTIFPAGNQRVLNRAGRAIARIMACNAEKCWSAEAIAGIFGISDTSVRRAVENGFYKNVDDTEDDYALAGDPGFRVHFPPLDGESVDAWGQPILIPKSLKVCTPSEGAVEAVCARQVGGTTATRLPRASKIAYYNRLAACDSDDSDSDSEREVSPPRKRPRYDESSLDSSSILPLDRGSLNDPTISSMPGIFRQPSTALPTADSADPNDSASTSWKANSNAKLPPASRSSTSSISRRTPLPLPKPKPMVALKPQAPAAPALPPSLSAPRIDQRSKQDVDLEPFLRTSLPSHAQIPLKLERVPPPILPLI
ncbi:hypothetical protein MKEN_00973800 [Mycena kentingensis (nom. inval.)]|nr:hypothetical protein MKEN_00973800 [Mycena kentingensis (nom. inval.)]